MVAVPQRFDDHDHDHDHDDSTRLAAAPSLIVNLDPPSAVRPAPPGRSLS
jgi:hypothetical protein